MFGWLFRKAHIHKKVYDGVVDAPRTNPDTKCEHGWSHLQNCDVCFKTVQLCRWHCAIEGCNAMGEDRVMVGQGYFKVHHGDLVPDEKGWANAKVLGWDED